MSYVRKHPKTGIFWYRRFVPEPLRPHLPQVEGFADKACRTEFTRTLGVRTIAQANRAAAGVDVAVQAALDEAQRRLSNSKMPDLADRKHTGSGEAEPPTARPRPPIKPADLFAAPDRWKIAEIRRLEIATLNGESTEVLGDAFLGIDGTYHIQQAGRNPHAETWRKIPQFDSALIEALRSVGVELIPDHPAIPRVRSDFAVAWYDLRRSRDHMNAGLWDYSSHDTGNTAPAVASIPSPTIQDASPDFLSRLDQWKATLTMKPRQASVSESDIRQFANHLGDVGLASVKRAHAQQWVEILAQSIVSKTINRKLSALRNYWGYIQAHQLVADDAQPFSRLRIPKVLGNEPKPFSAEEVVKLWRVASDSNDAVLADAIQIAAFTGARIESIFRMKANDQIIKDDIACFQFSDKTEAGKRLVPLHSAITPLIERLLADHQEGGYLLPSKAKNKYDERSAPASKRFGHLKNKLNYGAEFRFHSIRHTVSTLFEQCECPEGVAADVLGHEKKTETYGVYSGGTSVKQRKEWMEKALIYPDKDFMGLGS